MRAREDETAATAGTPAHLQMFVFYFLFVLFLLYLLQGGTFAQEEWY